MAFFSRRWYPPLAKIVCKFSTRPPRTGQESFSALGKRYEESCQGLLASLGLSTRLVGGASDGGVDLVGHWQLETALTVSVVAQCKKIGRSCPPVYLRELEGTLTRHPAGTLGILLCSSAASKASLAALNGSPTPLAFIHFDAETLCSIVLNGAVQTLLPRLIIASRHVRGRVEPVLFYRTASPAS